MRNLARVILAASLALPAMATAAMAQHYEHWRGGGDIHAFHERDYGAWRGGHWYHGNHGGRLGWWWIAGGSYYFYPAPIYPYPDPYIPPVAAAPQQPGQYWYYCPSPQGYYPYVPSCAVAWQPVPAVAPPR